MLLMGKMVCLICYLVFLLLEANQLKGYPSLQENL
jgi:hypothetical protein